MKLSVAMREAKEVRAMCERLEMRLYGRSWTTEDLAMGLVGDVGDLVKLIQAVRGIRDIPDYSKQLEHELADCLWSILVLADKLEVDIETAFKELIYDLKTSIESQLGA